MKASILLALPVLATLLLLPAAAEEHAPSSCASCGCSSFKLVCRLVCEMREDIDYEYDVDRDPYCLPGVSEIRGKKWVRDCNSLLGFRKVLIWQPRCTCKVRTRKTLVKIPVIKKVPAYNCVVNRVCCECGKSEVDAQATAEARQQGIMPESVDSPIVLDTGEPVATDTAVASREAIRR